MVEFSDAYGETLLEYSEEKQMIQSEYTNKLKPRN